MAELSKIFKSNELYETWRNNKEVPSNVLAVVLDETGNDVEKVAFGTNDITGSYETYEVAKGQEPTGTINITENGENIDVKQYATANVNVATVQPKIYSFSYYHEQYGSATFPAGTGIGGSTLGWEMLVGETYDMVVIASSEVAQHLDQLYLKGNISTAIKNFANATVTTTTADGQTFARIALTDKYPAGSDDEVGLYYNGTKYIAVVAG